MTSSTKSLYAGHRFPPELISYTVWLYFRFPLSLRMVEEMLAFRGIEVSHERNRREVGGQAARTKSVRGSASVSNSWPKLEPSLPLRAAQRTWSRRSAPRRDHRICCDLFMRRLTRKLAVPSVIDVPTRRPVRWRSAWRWCREAGMNELPGEWAAR